MKSARQACWAGIFCVIIGLGPLAVFGQTPFSEQSMVRQKCSACHKLDTQGRIEVIEETRKTPEEWKVVVDRMIRLNSAPVEDKDFNTVIKELSRYLSLSPDEMSKIAYINSDENSQYREVPQNDLEKRMYRACVRCHTWGKLASHRNTRGQWDEVRTLHLALYPTAIFQMREMDWPKEFTDLEQQLSQLFRLKTLNGGNGWKPEKTLISTERGRSPDTSQGTDIIQGPIPFRPPLTSVRMSTVSKRRYDTKAGLH